MKKYIQPIIKIRKASHARMICTSPGLNSSYSTGGQFGKERDDAYDDYNNYDNENLW